MNKDKISSQEIIDLVASKASVSKRAAEEFLKVMFATIEEALLAGESVKVKGFGTFKLQWNEPRKSVNVQSGEEILLAGYHKVSFTPDAVLKAIVNEPFAHLEPVQLDAEGVAQSPQIEVDEASDPLRMFTEQASEIKNLISEIQALSAPASADANELLIDEAPALDSLLGEGVEVPGALVVELQSEKVDEVVDQSAHQSTEHSAIAAPDASLEVVVEAPEVLHVESAVESPSSLADEVQTEENTAGEVYTPNPFLKDVKPVRKIGVGAWLLITCTLLLGVGTGMYFLYPPAAISMQTAAQGIATTLESVKSSSFISGVVNTVGSWFEPSVEPAPAPVSVVVVAKDTVAADTVVPEVDSLQLLLDGPRTYEQFIASERIVAGSRLARMALHYYGTSDFWVYIYEANKDKIPNPDNIMAGTLIRIPKLDARLIDASNPRCMEKAKALHDEYVQKKK